MMRRLKFPEVLQTPDPGARRHANPRGPGLPVTLDVIIPWTLNDYLDMNAGRRSWFQRHPQGPPGLALQPRNCWLPLDLA